jgi:uncharacterized membrane protein YgdD (TMEM256/DUF423 family)
MEARLNRMIQVGAFLAGIAVMFGALGAHLLQNLVTEVDLDIWKIGVQYQFYHAIAILITAAVYAQHDRKGLKWTYRFFLLGIFIFSGSLYTLALSDTLIGSRQAWLGAITPIGGIFFIVGWVSFFLSFFRKK